MVEKSIEILARIRIENPLIEAISNYVTLNDCANILLALGASPAMCEAYDEAYAFSQLTNGVYVNIGSLPKEQETAIMDASLAAKKTGIPFVLDPVACGAIPKRYSIIQKIQEIGKIDVIKGNIGEIQFLAGIEGTVRGTDSIDIGANVIEAAIQVAKAYNCVVTATGEKDIVTDGERVYTIGNHTPLFQKITGAGCMLGALTAGSVSCARDDLLAGAVAAAVFMGIAGELAYETAKLPGSFRVKLMDCIYALDEAVLRERAKITQIH